MELDELLRSLKYEHYSARIEYAAMQVLELHQAASLMEGRSR